jgi:hypothetical protein
MIGILTETNGILILHLLDQSVEDCCIRETGRANLLVHVHIQASDLKKDGVSVLLQTPAHPACERTLAVFSNFFSAFLNPVTLRICDT